MEIEYKWDFDGRRLAQVLESDLLAGLVGAERVVTMHARYYDTPDAALSRQRVGLRVREENGVAVCCMKTPAAMQGAAKTRNEYEVEAPGIKAGLRLLPGAGAPAELCDRLAAAPLELTCETEFVRRAFGLDGAFRAELAYDKGVLRRCGRQAPIDELELEYAGGRAEKFHEFAELMEKTFGLVVQPLSKLARAMNLSVEVP